MKPKLIPGPLTGQRVRLIKEWWVDMEKKFDPTDPGDAKFRKEFRDGWLRCDSDLKPGALGTIRGMNIRYLIDWDETPTMRNAYTWMSEKEIADGCEVLKEVK